jgi:hypothetical protein
MYFGHLSRGLTMAKGNGLITADQAKAAGTALGECCTQLAAVSDIEAAQGAVVGSMYRLQAMARIAEVLNTPAVEAMIMFAAEAGAIEVAGNVRGDQVLSVSKQAVTRGYLLADAAGPQFAIISGKGGAAFLVKEAGHRHKLRQAGATQIKATAAALRMEPRANAVGKFDMVLAGVASCVLRGETITVERSEQMPMRLPCYESDGPDGVEAKARRRLIRDLWLTISGEEPTGEMMEPEESDSFSERPITMLDEPPQGPSAAGLYEATKNEVRDIANSIKDKSERQAVVDLVQGLEKFETLQDLADHEAELLAAADPFSHRLRQLLVELIQYRRQMLGEA